MAQDKQAVTAADIGKKFEEIFSAAEGTGVRLYAESSKNDDRVELRFSFQAEEDLNVVRSISTRHVISNDSIVDHLDCFIKEYLSKLPKPKPVTTEERIKALFKESGRSVILPPPGETTIYVSSGDKFEHNVTVKSGSNPVVYRIAHQNNEENDADDLRLEERGVFTTDNHEWFLVGTAPDSYEWTILGHVIEVTNVYGTNRKWYWTVIEPKDMPDDAQVPSWD